MLYSQYRYDPLEGPREIRLVRVQPGARQRSQLRCSLKTVSLESTPLYAALSYTWGSPYSKSSGGKSPASAQSDLSPIRILLNGHSISVTENLADALFRFSRLGVDQYLWIDAICINQADLLERNSQVSIMGDIYASAHTVLVWLGEEDWNFKVANVFVTKFLPKVEALIKNEARDQTYSYSLTNLEFYDRLGEPEISQEIWDGLAEFLDRKWFSRVWTFQEALLARGIEVYCGEEKLSWDRLRDLLHFLALSDWDSRLTRFQKPSWKQSEQLPGVSLLSLMQQRGRLLNRKSVKMARYQVFLQNISGGSGAMDCLLGHLAQFIYLMRLRSATDPRDHIIGLYGITQRLCNVAAIENPLPQPDYSKSTSAVFTECYKALLGRSKSLELLSSVEDESQRARTDLPSWVPDLTTIGNVGLSSLGNGDHYDTSRKQPKVMFPSEKLETLSIAGYCIDIVAELGDDDDSLAGSGAHGPFERTSTLFLHLPKVTYVNGQDRTEVFWRAMIADQANGISPAPASTGTAFHQHLLMHLSTCLLDLNGYQLGKVEEMRTKMVPIINLSTTSEKAATLIPSMAEIEARRDVYATIHSAKQAKSPDIISDTVRETWYNVLKEEEKAIPFAREIVSTFAAKRFLRTNGNLIGIGPRSAQVGDGVFVLPGARVPFILRKRLDGTYKLVGEAYLHGIMRGEGLDRDDLKLMRLDLV